MSKQNSQSYPYENTICMIWRASIKAPYGSRLLVIADGEAAYLSPEFVVQISGHILKSQVLKWERGRFRKTLLKDSFKVHCTNRASKFPFKAAARYLRYSMIFSMACVELIQAVNNKNKNKNKTDKF